MVFNASSDFRDRLLYAQTRAAEQADHVRGTSRVDESVATSRGGARSSRSSCSQAARARSARLTPISCNAR
jgi:hypothetical protein